MQDGARLGLIVGKRQLKRAVDRNQVKRVLRETFRVNRSILPAIDIVVQLAETPSTSCTSQAKPWRCGRVSPQQLERE